MKNLKFYLLCGLASFFPSMTQAEIISCPSGQTIRIGEILGVVGFYSLKATVTSDKGNRFNFEGGVQKLPNTAPSFSNTPVSAIAIQTFNNAKPSKRVFELNCSYDIVTPSYKEHRVHLSVMIDPKFKTCTVNPGNYEFECTE